jgi:hypothetical protein
LGKSFRDVLGNRSNKLKGAVSLEITFIAAMAHLRTVDNHTRFLYITQLGQRKGVADDVLGDILNALVVSRFEPDFVMDTAPNNSHGISSDTKLKFLLH